MINKSKIALVCLIVIAVLSAVYFGVWHFKSQQSDQSLSLTTPVATDHKPSNPGSAATTQKAAPVVVQPTEIAAQGDPPPGTSTISVPVPDREIIASGWKTETNTVMTSFRNWTERYLETPIDQRTLLITEGVELAQARRAALSELIPKDPRRALADAVPMALREQLPLEVVALLEERVGAFGNLTRIYPYPPTPTPQWFDYTQVDGKSYKAHRYGKRASLAALRNSSLIGIALDDQLAVVDSPVRLLEVGETVEGRLINESCPVSGETVTTVGEGRVTQTSDAPIQVGNQLLGICTPEHTSNIEFAVHCMEIGAEATAVNGGVNIKAIQEKLKELRIMAYGGAPGTAWPGQPPTNLTHGAKRVIVYRVQMQNWTTFPAQYSEAYCHDILIGNQCPECWDQPSRSVGNQLSDFSYGKMWFSQVDVTPVMELPKTRDEYIANYWGTVLEDSRAAATSLGYNVSSYDFQVIVHSGLDWGACGWGGDGVVWVNQCYGAVVLEHELGHGMWLPHANGWMGITDGNPWSPGRTHAEYYDGSDPMGTGNWSPNNSYNSFFRYLLNWIPASSVIQVTTNSTYRIYQHDLVTANPSNTMALMFPHDGTSSYWVSFRGNAQVSNFGNAAEILEVRNNATDTHVLDFNNANSDNSDGGLDVGQSFYDPEANLTLRTIALGGTSPTGIWILK